MPEQNIKYDRLIRISFFIILAVGLGLRFYQYLMGRTLWEDETHLALNYIKYGYIRLLQPMDFIQAAPLIFNYATKTFGLLFNYNELSLRAFPFIWSVLTLPLFYHIALQLTKRPAVALISFLLFSVNMVLIYFSTELKPYAVDVSVYLLMVYLTMSMHPYVVKHRTALLAVGGCVCILSSNVTFIVLICIGCYMLMKWVRNRSIPASDIIIIASWAVVFLTNYFLFIHNHPATHDQRVNYAFAFCPTNVFSPAFASFMSTTIRETFFTMLLMISSAYGFAWVLLLIVLVAVGYILFRKQWALLIFVVLPILLHLALSALKLYPFWYRLILYLVPCFIIIISLGTWLIAEFLMQKTHKAVGVAFVLLCCVFFTNKSIAGFPMWPKQITPALEFVNSNAGKHVYLIDPVNAYRYYYYRGKVKDSVYAELPWTMTPEEYYHLMEGEQNEYILFYGAPVDNGFQWGFGDVIKDLKAKHLFVKNLEARGFGVGVVKPLNPIDSNVLVVGYEDFEGKYTSPAEKIITLWGWEVVSNPVPIKAGAHAITIVSKGTPVKGEYPHLHVFVNDREVGAFYTTHSYGDATFRFSLDSNTSARIRLTMDNDLREVDEDRNAFISRMYIKNE
jgi:hypothetical protein